MVTLIEKYNNHSTWGGLSTDTKPVKYTTEAPNGARNCDIFIEMDTKKVYMFDEAGTQWREQ